MYGGWDIHCHILPGVDDGAQSPEETSDMLLAAKRAGINRITATPHLRDTADAERIRQVFGRMEPHFEQSGVAASLGFECDYRLLVNGADLRPFCMAGTCAVLLEFWPHYFPQQWENSIGELHRAGLEVIVAHPERYPAIQQDARLAARMAQIGCELQLSADSLSAGLLSKARKTALELLNMGLIAYIASDAHCAQDYQAYARAMQKYGGLLRPERLLSGQ